MNALNVIVEMDDDEEEVEVVVVAAAAAAEAATAAITKQINAKTIEQLLANMRQKIKEQQSRA